jgi:hypothetical protein
MAAVRQRATRYQPDKTATAQVHYGPTPEIARDLSVALICDISKSGCKLVPVNARPSKNGDVLFVAHSGGEYMRATQKWHRAVDPTVTIIGFEFFSAPSE